MSQQQQAAQHAQVRDTVRQQIASSYQLTPDRALMMATEPERVLPDMAADITLNAYEATVATLQQQMPQIIAEHPQIRQQMAHVVQSTIQQMFAVHQAENDFFTVNQDLRQVPKHEIDRISALYIQANRGNPGLTRDIATREIGILVRNMLGLSPSTNAPAPNAQQPPAAQPQYQNGNGNIVARTPLGPGSVAPSPTPSFNVFADMVNHARNGR
jgi:DNA repair ATPase RecN